MGTGERGGRLWTDLLRHGVVAEAAHGGGTSGESKVGSALHRLVPRGSTDERSGPTTSFRDKLRRYEGCMGPLEDEEEEERRKRGGRGAPWR